MKRLLLAMVVLSLGITTAQAGCSKEEAKKSVEKMCALIAKKGDAAIAEIKKYRYCDNNYVWIQDSDVKMVVHPIKRRLNGKSLKKVKDKKGLHLFVEFDKMAKSNPNGGWVDYYWTKPGDEAPTPKTSFVKVCGGDKKWIAGSGIWK